MGSGGSERVRDMSGLFLMKLSRGCDCLIRSDLSALVAARRGQERCSQKRTLRPRKLIFNLESHEAPAGPAQRRFLFKIKIKRSKER